MYKTTNKHELRIMNIRPLTKEDVDFISNIQKEITRQKIKNVVDLEKLPTIY